MSSQNNKSLRAEGKTIVMGILNITPDSFSDGSINFRNVAKAVSKAEEMVKEGAHIIDIGGESTRPQSKPISITEELNRIIPVIKGVRKKIDKKILISVDTYKSQVASLALDADVDMINSLGGFMFDKKMAKIAGEHRCPIVMYHIKGIPQTMQKGTIKYKDVIEEVSQFFETQIAFGLKHGVKKHQFILDPGIGFGKTLLQNIEIIQRLNEFKKFHLPIAIGISRKSHLGKMLQDELRLKNPPPPQDRLEASLAETALAVLNGVTIVRTHDVFSTKNFLAVLDVVRNQKYA